METLVKVVQILSIGFIVIGVIMIAIPIIVLFNSNGKVKEEEVIVGEAEVVDNEEKEQ